MDAFISFIKEIISIEGFALVFSGIAILISLAQFFSERNRSRKEATIHAFDELEENVFSKKHYKKLVIRAGEEYALSGKPENDQEKWNEATLALSRIEHFAVGVNTKIYDLKTLNRMAGGFILEEFSRWKPIIETKRIQTPNSKHYDEFETMCVSLKKLRGIDNNGGSEKDSDIDRVEANRIVKKKQRKRDLGLLFVCLGTFLIASYLFWEPIIFSSSIRDNALTAVNILISMSTSGLVMLFYRIPLIKKKRRKLETICLIVIAICIAVNVILSLVEPRESLNFIMTIVTGMGTGCVALLFSIHNTTLEEQDAKDKKWVQKHSRRRPKSKK